jgi:L-ascorbate metabolism protein UlaG (beta-lactamase superfamily)
MNHAAVMGLAARCRMQFGDTADCKSALQLLTARTIPRFIQSTGRKNFGMVRWKIFSEFSNWSNAARLVRSNQRMIRESPELPAAPRRKLPRSFRDLTPAKHFNPRTFFQELVWKGWFTPRHGRPQRPIFPKLKHGQVAVTWIGHASFLIQFSDLNVLIDPNFANWLFLLKRIKRAGLRLRDLPRIDLVLLTHAHFDHFHKPTLRKLPAPKIGVLPRGVGDLARNLGFSRVIELEWWESFSQGDWKVTFTPSKHWGARTLRDSHRGYGGFVLEHQGRKIYHAGDSAYFDGFAEIGKKLRPEIALLPIGAYHPESFRQVHMGPDEAVQAFKDLRAKFFVPMHYGTFKLSFEAMDEPPRLLREIAARQGQTKHLKILDEGVPKMF